MNTDFNTDRIAELTIRYLDRTLTEGEAAELDQMVCESNECRDIFEEILAQAGGIAQASIPGE